MSSGGLGNDSEMPDRHWGSGKLGF